MPETLDIRQLIQEWLASCTPKKRKSGEPARNLVAVGFVVLDRLRQKCPLEKEELFTAGGELAGARTGLRKVFERYSLPTKYLKEATGRQAATYAERLLSRLEYGKVLLDVPADVRDQILREGIGVLTEYANAWFLKQNLKVSFDRQCSPSSWVGSILQQARGRSGGKVEQHLVGAKLQKRHPKLEIPNHPGFAGDVQTKRTGDYELGHISYHVTAVPTRGLIEKCTDNVASNRSPILVVPRDEVARARILAQEARIEQRITILALEEFIANNVIEISVERGTSTFDTLKAIIDEYNRRIEVENNPSLKIEIQ